jgi:mRNA interferase MazF
MSGMTIKPFELFTINFPFSDLSGAKQRPVLALSLPDSNGDFVCLAVTSKSGHPDSIRIIQADLISGFLPKPSFVRPDKIYTLHVSLLKHTVGVLTDAKAQEIKNSYCQKLGCK